MAIHETKETDFCFDIEYIKGITSLDPEGKRPAMKEGREEGRTQGLAEGRDKALEEVAFRMFEIGKEDEEILRISE